MFTEKLNCHQYNFQAHWRNAKRSSRKYLLFLQLFMVVPADPVLAPATATHVDMVVYNLEKFPGLGYSPWL